MIASIPPNFGFSFLAIAVWRREPTAKDAAAALLDAAGKGAPNADGELATPQQRLIYKGYEWQPVAQWYPVVNPAWDHYVDDDPDEVRERAIRQERERQLARHHASSAFPPSRR
jgi:hypothetical protein